jgi:tartrate dehydratase beta subunit/fumarate hydratase class I family protein
MLAKGNRSRQVTDACNTYGGFYLGSIGGPAARLAQDCITKVEVLEYAQLGMESVWKIEVPDFAAFFVARLLMGCHFCSAEIHIFTKSVRLCASECKTLRCLICAVVVGAFHG